MAHLSLSFGCRSPDRVCSRAIRESEKARVHGAQTTLNNPRAKQQRGEKQRQPASLPLSLSVQFSSASIMAEAGLPCGACPRATGSEWLLFVKRQKKVEWRPPTHHPLRATCARCVWQSDGGGHPHQIRDSFGTVQADVCEACLGSPRHVVWTKAKLFVTLCPGQAEGTGKETL